MPTQAQLDLWTLRANTLLQGRRIMQVRYERAFGDEAGAVLVLDDGTFVLVQRDDEGNGPGALSVQPLDAPAQLIPTLR